MVRRDADWAFATGRRSSPVDLFFAAKRTHERAARLSDERDELSIFARKRRASLTIDIQRAEHAANKVPLGDAATRVAEHVVAAALTEMVRTDRRVLLNEDPIQFNALVVAVRSHALNMDPGNPHAAPRSRWAEIPEVADRLDTQSVARFLQNTAEHVRAVAAERVFWLREFSKGVVVQHANSGIRARASMVGTGLGTMMSDPERVPEVAQSPGCDGAAFVGMGIGRCVYRVAAMKFPDVRWRIGHPASPAALGVRRVLHAGDPYIWEYPCDECAVLNITWATASRGSFASHSVVGLEATNSWTVMSPLETF